MNRAHRNKRGIVRNIRLVVEHYPIPEAVQHAIFKSLAKKKTHTHKNVEASPRTVSIAEIARHVRKIRHLVAFFATIPFLLSVSGSVEHAGGGIELLAPFLPWTNESKNASWPKEVPGFCLSMCCSSFLTQNLLSEIRRLLSMFKCACSYRNKSAASLLPANENVDSALPSFSSELK